LGGDFLELQVRELQRRSEWKSLLCRRKRDNELEDSRNV
jgi:hypothetical protein